MSGCDSQLPASYAALFATGTKPADWKEEPPTWEELMEQLPKQMRYIGDYLEEQLNRPGKIPDNPLGAANVSELFGIWIAHESMHAGMVKAMAMMQKR